MSDLEGVHGPELVKFPTDESEAIVLDSDDFDFVVRYSRSRESTPEEDARYERLLSRPDQP
jgi:hypothetical protein